MIVSLLLQFVTFSYLLRLKKMPRSHDFHVVVRICEISFIVLNVSFIGSPICLYMAFEPLQGQAQHSFSTFGYQNIPFLKFQLFWLFCYTSQHFIFSSYLTIIYL